MISAKQPPDNKQLLSMNIPEQKFSSLEIFLDRRIWIMLLLGFSAGLPLLLIFGTLSVWLREAGVARSMVTYFSWAALGYSFKFVWAPLVDQLPLPLLSHWLGRRRSWMLLSQLMIIIAIVTMANANPGDSENQLVLLAIGAVLLGFSSATQDIVIDAFRIESAASRLQALLSASYIAGYRIAMLVAGAGGLWLPEILGSVAGNYSYEAWRTTYYVLAGCMGVGIVTTLVVNEPVKAAKQSISIANQLQLVVLFVVSVAVFVVVYVLSGGYLTELRQAIGSALANKNLAGFIIELLRLVSAIFASFVIAKALISINVVSRQVLNQSYVEPLREFFQRYPLRNALILLALIGLYRVSDIVLGVIANVFYYDLGFDKGDIALVSKGFGLLMTIAGGFLGGILAYRYGVLRILLLGAILSAITNLLFVLLNQVGANMSFLYLTIGADNLSAGVAGAAFVAFLSALTNVRFTAMQYAIFTSLMTLLPKILGGYSGAISTSLGYSGFFVFTAVIGIPVILLILIARDRFDLEIPAKT